MIVMLAEVRQNGQWSKVGNEFVSTFKELEGQLTDRVFDGRDLALMSFLSNNCSYGIPSNASEEIRSHKYLNASKLVYNVTLHDILSYDWDSITYKTGCISEWQYERLKNDGAEPINILDKPIREDVEIVKPFEMDMIIQNQVLRVAPKYYVRYEYDKKKVRDKHKFFCETSIPSLIKLIPSEGTASDVRIIFSF